MFTFQVLFGSKLVDFLSFLKNIMLEPPSTTITAAKRKWIQPVPIVITEEHYKAVLTLPSDLQYLGLGGDRAASSLYCF